MRVQSEADGTIWVAELVRSTGYERLDDACLGALIGEKLIPATVNGAAAFSVSFVPINFAVPALAPSSPTPTTPPSVTTTLPSIRGDYLIKVGLEGYPQRARQQQHQGTCIVHVVIAESGTPRDPSVSKSSGDDSLDQACIDAVAGAPYLPGKQNGLPMEAGTEVATSWRLPPLMFAAIANSPTSGCPAAYPTDFPSVPGGNSVGAATFQERAPRQLLTISYQQPSDTLYETIVARAQSAGWILVSHEAGAEPEGIRYRASFRKDNTTTAISVFNVRGKTVLVVMMF